MIYVRLRATYKREIEDAAIAGAAWNDPGRIRSARDFIRHSARMPYSFNFLYADERDIAYVNASDMPLRARGVYEDLPVRGRSQFEWRRYDPDANAFAELPARSHPQVVNQAYITSWNNKPARGFRAPDNLWSYGSLYRSQMLDDRIKRHLRGPAKMSLTEVIDVMEDAGTVDFRGAYVLPWMLRVLGRPLTQAEKEAVRTLRAWLRDGAHRRDRDRDRVYEHSQAIRIMDAWWPLWVRAHFKRPLGTPLWEILVGPEDGGSGPFGSPLIEFGEDNPPNRGPKNNPHFGSAFQGSIYGHVQKDLRTILGRKVRGRFSRIYCGSGAGRRTRAQKLRGCRALARRTLAAALRADPAKLYDDPTCASQPAVGPEDPGRKPGDQWCFDSVIHQPTSALYQPAIHWINRPTWQIVAEVRGPRP